MANFLDENGVLYLWSKIKSYVSSAISGKVDKVDGKGLSTNDYTTAEKNKLSGIASGAEVNQNAFSNVVVGSTTVAADAKTDTLTLAGSNVTLTPDATNDKVTIGITKSNVTSALGYTPPAQDTTYGVVTTSANGLMSSSDKKKLDSVAIGAQVNQKAFSYVQVGDDIVAADSQTDTLELIAGTNVTLTPDLTPDSPLAKVKIAAKDTTYSNMTGATASAAGSSGLVPAPAKGKQGSFLRGDGTWETPTDTKYSVFTKSVNGLVPSPGSKVNGFLAPDATWKLPTIYAYCSVKDLNGNYSTTPYAVVGLMNESNLIDLIETSDGGKSYAKINTSRLETHLNNTFAKKSDLTNMYKYKGSVASASNLPTSGRTVGDVYNIEAAGTYGGAGMNVAWNGSAWDPLGEIFSVPAITNAKIDEICV